MLEETNEKPKQEKSRIEFSLLTKYKRIIRQAEFKISAEKWIIMTIVSSIATFFASFLLIIFFKNPVSQIISVALFMTVFDLMLGYPYLKAVKRIDLIEEALPEALKQMADTLKAGGTYEFALREIATAQYGPLSKEIDLVLRKIEEGENLENSMLTFAENTDSRLVERSVAIIIDSIKAGAGLVDVLDEISGDIREMHRIGVERKTQTLMQVFFMVAAGVFIAPIIFGFVSTIIDLFVKASAEIGATAIEKANSIAIKNFILLLLQIYIIISVFANSIMISLMREGRISKSIIYFPILLLIAFACYYAAMFLSAGLVG